MWEKAVPKIRAVTTCPAQTGTAFCTPCKGLPNSPSWTPTHEIESGGCQAEQQHESHQLEVTSLGETPTSHSNWKCCFPFPQTPQFHISSGKCCSHRADGVTVTQKLVKQMTIIKHKPPPYPNLFCGGTHMRRDSHLQLCLVNTPPLCSHHIQAPKLTHTWFLSLHDQHRLSARAVF